MFAPRNRNSTFLHAVHSFVHSHSLPWYPIAQFSSNLHRCATISQFKLLLKKVSRLSIQRRDNHSCRRRIGDFFEPHEYKYCMHMHMRMQRAAPLALSALASQQACPTTNPPPRHPKLHQPHPPNVQKAKRGRLLTLIFSCVFEIGFFLFPTHGNLSSIHRPSQDYALFIHYCAWFSNPPLQFSQNRESIYHRKLVTSSRICEDDV